ncbi:hypothetical protein [Saccharothrix luteola]|uniref:hypothetical protein n=1 Tax=Saccharothrix luteola TaxID=2893018 RepID=UPI001E58BC4E|nr:hypothetical protein [Saccharothrix luteola]MCC8244677.1 hypothetical protein [Saccharothrix luteola]
MITGGGGNARQAETDGAGGRLWLRVSAVLCWLCALIPLAVWYLEDLDWPWWALVGVVIAMVVLAALGGDMWATANRAEADTARLRQAGRPAIAEVVGLEVVHQEEGPDTSVLSLRIGGDDVPPFDATYRGRHRPDHRVGARFDAVVDPTDNLFALEPRLGPR